MTSEIAIGIDLGTTNTCVSIYRNDDVEIIPNAFGKTVTPSYVCFTNDDRFIGDEAKNKAIFCPQNTIFSAKRLIGRKFDDPVVQEDMKHWPFEIINYDSKPKFKLIINNVEKTYFPEEISSMILGYVKESAEKFLKMPVTNCVITVPAYFNDSQRQATIDAGKIANLNVMKIINEPTSAAIAYGILKKHEKQNVLIYDLGGGTFDVSILQIVGTSIKVLGTSGNTHLGGDDFDNEILKFLISEFKQLHNENLNINERDLQRLRTICEKAKVQLSSATSTDVEIESISGHDFNYALTREKFEEINSPLFESTLETIDNCMNDIDMDKLKIDEIILVGGSTRIPYVQKMVSEFFHGKQLSKVLNTDEAVARGAAIQASMMLKMKSNIPLELTITDITPLSLGIALFNGDMSFLINKNTKIPYEYTKIYLPGTKETTVVSILVYEGENHIAEDNNLLGKFTVAGFKPRTEANSELNVTFNIDINNILTVTCVEKLSNLRNQITIQQDKGRLTKEEFENIRVDEEQYRRMADKRRKLADLRNKLVNLCFETTDKMKMNENIDTYKASQKVIEKCDEILNWTDENQMASPAEYLAKYVELATFIEQKMNKEDA